MSEGEWSRPLKTSYFSLTVTQELRVLVDLKGAELLGIFIPEVCRQRCPVDLCSTYNKILTFSPKSLILHRLYKQPHPCPIHFCSTYNTILTFSLKSSKNRLKSIKIRSRSAARNRKNPKVHFFHFFSLFWSPPVPPWEAIFGQKSEKKRLQKTTKFQDTFLVIFNRFLVYFWAPFCFF